MISEILGILFAFSGALFVGWFAYKWAIKELLGDEEEKP